MMNRNLLVIHLVLAAAASRTPNEEVWLVQARQRDADEVGRRADDLARARRLATPEPQVPGVGPRSTARLLTWS